MIGKAEVVNQVGGDFCRLVGIRMTLDSSSPIDSGESETGATQWILHVHQRGEVMLLGVTLIGTVARELEFSPQDAIFDSEKSVSPSHEEEVRTHSEFVEGDLR